MEIRISLVRLLDFSSVIGFFVDFSRQKLKGTTFELSKMLEFKINRKVSFDNTKYVRRRRITELRLNSQWTILLVLRTMFLLDYCLIWAIDSIEIHRKNTTGKFLVSGEITLEGLRSKRFKRKFSQFFETGTSIIEISSHVGGKGDSHTELRVFANVFVISTKLLSGTANEEIIKTLQMKSLVELSKDFDRLLEPESSSFADVTLKCGGVSIPGHKIILSARSPVFAAMFANPMRENGENEVDITDMDVSVLRELLVYMYTAKTSDLTSTSAADLLFAAEKYQLQDLKAVCTHHMMLTVSFQNVWNLLALGDLLSEDLKSFAIDYIRNTCGEMSALENTEEWKTLLKERPDLALKVSESFG